METVAKDIYYVGVDDRKIDLFEGMYSVPDGVSYNSYVIKDEKIAVMDTVDAAFKDEWLNNVFSVLGDRSPDYLVVQHMEPDHSACVAAFLEKYPRTAVVGNQKTFTMLCGYFGDSFAERRLCVTDGEELSLGGHKLKFIFAPMVHWPEVMFTYDYNTATLFSADGFGRFGALKGGSAGEWIDEARRYYIGIVGKYGMQVSSALAKLAALNIEAVAPLHGPVLKGDELSGALAAYSKWCGYLPELKKATLIVYNSVYGHTRAAAFALAEELKMRGEKVKIMDLSRDDWAECVAQAFRFPKIVISATTYNADLFPSVREFIDRLAERNFKNRFIGIVESGSWAPVSAKLINARLEKCKGLTFAENVVTVRCALNAESGSQIVALAEELCRAE